MPHDMQFKDCYARASSDMIVLGNAAIERRWRIHKGLFFPQSILDHNAGAEWLARPGQVGVPQPASPPVADARSWSFQVHSGPQNAVERPCLVLDAYASGNGCGAAIRFQIFPDVAAVSLQYLTATSLIEDWNTAARNEAVCVPGAHVPSTAGPAIPDSASATGIETPPADSASELPMADLLEHLDLRPPHLRIVQVDLRDQTDIHNELVFEREWLLHPNEANLALQGNLFICEDPLTGHGMILLKEAPLPGARPYKTTADFRVSPRPALYYDPAPSQAFSPAHAKWPLCYRVALYGHGTGPRGGLGYRWVTLTYTHGKAGRTQVLQQYQRSRRPFDPARDARFISNTWGDRSRDTHINASFVTQEIQAGARLGVDVTQIDDGWQKGVTSNSAMAKEKGGVWEGYHQANPDFWAIDQQRFPQGLDPLLAQLRSRTMGLGLWFSPDSHQDFVNWQKDAAVILALHRTHGINFFKIDGVKARTRLGEYRLHRFFDEVLQASGGRVVFDLDVTAEIRPGYFGLLHTGPLFVENRYTDFHRYWPHHTLRNLWKLAHYIDPLRLRMEFLNPARHRTLYQDDPLAPHAYDAAYLFATVMCSNPLGWFEVSHLDASFVDVVAPLVHVWKAHRTAFFSNTIYPIGHTPDGTTWTGFLSAPPEATAPAYLVLFRELNDRPAWTGPLPLPHGAEYTACPLAGNGSLTLAHGLASALMPSPRSYLFARLDPVSPNPCSDR